MEVHVLVVLSPHLHVLSFPYTHYILSYHLRLGLPSVVSFGFSDQYFYEFLISPMRASCPAHLISLI
jgi:hypothetical protein